MKEKKESVEEGFYRECSEILGVDSEYKNTKPTAKRYDRETGKLYMPMTSATRWGGREPGNGRYPGFGTIRMFSTNLIHVSLNKPIRVHKTFTSTEEVLEFLREIIRI